MTPRSWFCYRGGPWTNREPDWMRVVQRLGNPAYYSSVGLSFRTTLAGRQPR